MPVLKHKILAIKCYYDMENYICKTYLKEEKFMKK